MNLNYYERCFSKLFLFFSLVFIQIFSFRLLLILWMETMWRKCDAVPDEIECRESMRLGWDRSKLFAVAQMCTVFIFVLNVQYVFYFVLKLIGIQSSTYSNFPLESIFFFICFVTLFKRMIKSSRKYSKSKFCA